MSSNSWNQTLITAQGDGTALANSAVAASLLPGAAKFVLPSNLFNPGVALRLRASGRMSSAASTPGTFTFDVRFGSTVVFNGGASATLATSAVNLAWELDLLLTCRTIGSGTAATLIGGGRLLSAALAAATPIMLLPASAPAVGSGFDSTASQVVDLFGTWSVANASNTMTLHQYELALLN
jgi:hypothetical protein